MSDSITKAMEAVVVASGELTSAGFWDVQRELLKAFDALTEARRALERAQREQLKARAAA